MGEITRKKSDFQKISSFLDYQNTAANTNYLRNWLYWEFANGK